MCELNGVIPVLKPAGMTSHDVVAMLRKKLGTKKIGHTGTLDPMVTGVLPVLIGRATRLSDYFMEMPKTYSATGMLGISTDTEDSSGKVVETADISHVDKADVERVLSSFSGTIEQIPPDYSAVKINGKKLLDYVHLGERIPQKKIRRVHVYRIQLHTFIDGEFRFDITCSKGTYVRTICADLGKKLGVVAHMKTLVRTHSGGFSVEEAVAPDAVSAESVIPLSLAVRRINTLGRIVLPKDEAVIKKLLNGIKFDLRTCARRMEEPRREIPPYAAGDGADAKDVEKPEDLRNPSARQISDPKRNPNARRFVFVEDVFYGITDSRFQLEYLIKDE